MEVRWGGLWKEKRRLTHKKERVPDGARLWRSQMLETESRAEQLDLNTRKITFPLPELEGKRVRGERLAMQDWWWGLGSESYRNSCLAVYSL